MVVFSLVGSLWMRLWWRVDFADSRAVRVQQFFIRCVLLLLPRKRRFARGDSGRDVVRPRLQHTTCAAPAAHVLRHPGLHSALPPQPSGDPASWRQEKEKKKKKKVTRGALVTRCFINVCHVWFCWLRSLLLRVHWRSMPFMRLGCRLWLCCVCFRLHRCRVDRFRSSLRYVPLRLSWAPEQTDERVAVSYLPTSRCHVYYR